jgi:dolichol-phosphate mannosyltransferase
MELSIVIPVYNEADNITTLLKEIQQALDSGPEYEVIVVDDCSTDTTNDQLQAYRAGMPQLRIIRHARNSGQSTGVRSGVRHARADWIVTLDGDGQNDPADIPNLLKTRDEKGSDTTLVGGIRHQRKDTWVKRYSSRIANAVRGNMLGDNFPDTGCGIKLFPRQAFLTLPHFDHMHRFLPALFRRQGWDVVGVNVGHRPRMAGSSKYGTFDRLRVGVVDLFGVMWLARRPCDVQTEEVE